MKARSISSQSTDHVAAQRRRPLRQYGPLRSSSEKGLDAAAEDLLGYSASKFMLWHANGQARQNVREGIPPHLSGHPFYNPHADDIDFQIECDFIGLICPGMPQKAGVIADRVGHIMNYGEGYYAGLFLASLYAAAFVEEDLISMIAKASTSIPADCDYAAMLADLLACSTTGAQ